MVFRGLALGKMIVLCSVVFNLSKLDFLIILLCQTIGFRTTNTSVKKSSHKDNLILLNKINTILGIKVP